jgi:hypothetical protein
MKTKIVGLTLAFCFFSPVNRPCRRSADGHVEAERTQSEDHNRNIEIHHHHVQSMVGKIKVLGEGVDADSRPVRSEWTGKFDAEDYAVTAIPSQTLGRTPKVDDRTLNLTVKKHGRVIDTGRIVVSAKPHRRR